MANDNAPVPERTTSQRILSDPWFQIVLISFISFCNPGMYNALTGMGGSGQVNGTVAANSNVATHAGTAGAALVLVGAFYKYLGPRTSLLIGGWTYALYAGSLLCFNRTNNGDFVIGAGAVLGIGAAFFWVAEGTIMVTYTTDETRGRAIGIFWVIFNLGGAIGSLISFALNFHSKSGTVTDSTYIAYIIVMLFGWAASVLIRSTETLSYDYAGERISRDSKQVTWANLRDSVLLTGRILFNWRIMCLYPMFFNANVFYSYQQNNVNGDTFNLRTRSLNGALYWISQMLGGLFMGFLLDLRYFRRGIRAKVGWVVLITTGMVIWGGGYQFQLWNDRRAANGHKQDIDYTEASISAGPMILYFFYGMYDSFWQSYCYWIIGAQSQDPVTNSVIVAAYSALKPAGGSMAWRINAQKYSAMTQFAINWGMSIGSLLVAIPAVLQVTNSPVARHDQESNDYDKDVKDRSQTATIDLEMKTNSDNA